jgi:hypothetical protein
MTTSKSPGSTMSAIAEDVDGADLEPTAATRLLLQLMRTGAIDKTIARELGVSLRTVHRRITRVQQLLRVRSRFQLGVIACERGWVSPELSDVGRASPSTSPCRHSTDFDEMARTFDADRCSRLPQTPGDRRTAARDRPDQTKEES